MRLTLRGEMRPLLRTLIGLTMLVTALVLFQHRPVHAQSPEAASQNENLATYLPTAFKHYMPVNPPLCRFGVNGAVDGYAVELLRVGWYLDYSTNSNPARPYGIEYSPMIRLSQVGDSYRFYFASPKTSPGVQPATEEQLRDMIAKHPGVRWFIGNEPERVGIQDDLEPHIYAAAYHDLYTLIKAEDPTAKIFAGSIVQPTPLRLKYLDIVLNTYLANYGTALPADGWSIHNFILNEARCGPFDEFNCWGAGIPRGLDEIEGERVAVSENDDMERFIAQVRRFRQWLADHGYKGAPVFLSEYGVLMPDIFAPPDDYPPERVNAFMDATFDYILNTTDPELGDPTDGYRLIQRLSWYSVHDREYNGYLFENVNGSNVLSPMGHNYRDYTFRLDEVTDLYTVRTWTDPPVLATASSQVTLTVSAQIANSGNTMEKQPFVVRFYDGDPAQGGVQIGTDQHAELAGCGEDTVVQVQWTNADPQQVEDVYVQVIHMVDGQPVNAADQRDTLTRHRLLQPTHTIFAPSISWLPVTDQ